MRRALPHIKYICLYIRFIILPLAVSTVIYTKCPPHYTYTASTNMAAAPSLRHHQHGGPSADGSEGDLWAEVKLVDICC